MSQFYKKEYPNGPELKESNHDPEQMYHNSLQHLPIMPLEMKEMCQFKSMGQQTGQPVPPYMPMLQFSVNPYYQMLQNSNMYWPMPPKGYMPMPGFQEKELRQPQPAFPRYSPSMLPMQMYNLANSFPGPPMMPDSRLMELGQRYPFLPCDYPPIDAYYQPPHYFPRPEHHQNRMVKQEAIVLSDSEEENNRPVENVPEEPKKSEEVRKTDEPVIAEVEEWEQVELKKQKKHHRPRDTVIEEVVETPKDELKKPVQKKNEQLQDLLSRKHEVFVVEKVYKITRRSENKRKKESKKHRRGEEEEEEKEKDKEKEKEKEKEKQKEEEFKQEKEMIEPERKGYEVRYRKYKTKGNLKSKDGEPRRKRKYVTKKSRAEEARLLEQVAQQADTYDEKERQNFEHKYSLLEKSNKYGLQSELKQLITYRNPNKLEDTVREDPLDKMSQLQHLLKNGMLSRNFFTVSEIQLKELRYWMIRYRHSSSHGRLRVGSYFQSEIPILMHDPERLMKLRKELMEGLEKRRISPVTF